MNAAGVTGGRWTPADVPDQSGRTAAVTGASAGLGLQTAKVLAGRGASVVLACRDLGRAEANLLFTYELQQRLAAAGARTIALAAHPGNARTDLWRTSSLLERALISPRLRMLNFWIVQSAQLGALPALRAAADPSVQGGECYGPSGRFQYTGHPIRVESSAGSHDAAARRRLWEASERLTGVSYRIVAPSAQRVRAEDA